MADEIGMAAWHYLNLLHLRIHPILPERSAIRRKGGVKEYVCPMSGVTMAWFKYHRNAGRAQVLWCLLPPAEIPAIGDQTLLTAGCDGLNGS
jgi:hypothetical protein